MIVVRGNFDVLARDLAKLVEGRAKLYQALAEESLVEIEKGFAGEVDPWGRAWAKRSSKSRKRLPILTDTRRLRTRFGVTPTGTGFIIHNPQKYAPIHQFGGTIGGTYPRPVKIGTKWITLKRPVTLPKRPMIPAPRLSPSWQAALQSRGNRWLHGR